MASVTTREDLASFLNNPENAHELNGLVEDIRVEQTRGQRQTGRNDLPGMGERVA